MLAGKLESIADVRFPAYATPKLDGIRCLIVRCPDGASVAVSRKLKLIPNYHVSMALQACPIGLDGELMVPGATHFGQVTSAIMAHEGQPTFEYHVFDHFNHDGGYLERVLSLELLGLPDFVRVLTPTVVRSVEELDALNGKYLAAGYEGVMLRSADGPYKHGRSTLREGYLLKLKPWDDAEAEVVGFEERMENTNPQERDELGLAKRSSAKAGQVASGVLGALILRRPDGVEFNVGSGFDDADRERLWADRDALIGRLVKYRFQPTGGKNKPRIPTFLGFRHENDL
jgi:DNA ligase-1